MSCGWVSAPPLPHLYLLLMFYEIFCSRHSLFMLPQHPRFHSLGRAQVNLSFSALWFWISVTLLVGGGGRSFFFFSHVLIKFVSCSLSLCVIREKYTLEQDIREAEETIRHKTTEVQVWWNVEMYKADECCDAGSFLPPAQLTGTINRTYCFHFFLASLEVYHQF